MTDQELIQGLAEKDETAFRWLVESYRNRVFGTILPIVQDREDAEDAAQEVFIQVFESFSTFRGQSSLSTWIYRIAVHKALDKLRRRKTREKLRKWIPWWMPADTPETFHHPGIELDQRERAASLFRAINSLPEKQCLAFTLIKVQGMSYEEASRILQQSTKALESLVTRAKINLQKKLESLYKKD